MALVIKTDTREYSPTYNRMDVAVFQNDAGIRTKPDYKYRMTIYINDNKAALTRVILTKQSPDPIHGLGVQDVSAIVSNYINEVLVPYDSNSGFALTEDGIVKYWIQYGEEYRLTASDPIVVYDGLLTGADKYAWGASLEHHRFIDFYNNTEYTNYIMDSNYVGQFLTNYKTPSVQITDLGWHWILTDDAVNLDYVQIKTYDIDGVLIDTFEVSNLTSTGLDQSRLLTLATAPQSLNNITSGFLVGAQPVITPSVATYTIQCFRNLTTVVGEMLTFTIEEPCFYEVFRIHFENEYGAFDSYNFRLNSKRSADGERKTFITNKDVLSVNGLSYEHATENKLNYYTKFTNKISLKSDFITYEVNEWLKELAFAQKAYIEFTDNSGVANFKPCLIKNTKWTEQKDEVDKLFTFELEVELSDNFKQRR